MDLTTVEWLAHCTVRIETRLQGGGTGTGTGFFYKLNGGEAPYVPLIVTNKHVIRNAQAGKFVVPLSDGNGGIRTGSRYAFEVDNFEGQWTSHPDPNVDLCAMPIKPLLDKAEATGVRFGFHLMSKQFLPSTEDISEFVGLEEILMIGYPNGIWDEVNNLPIFRRGVIATNYKIDWNGKNEFLIDAACFPGSSGSPVMLVDIGRYVDRKGTHLGKSRVKLLGILYAGPQHTVQGEVLIVPIPIDHRAISIAGIPNNLGIVIKAEQLLSFEGMFNGS